MADQNKCRTCLSVISMLKETLLSDQVEIDGKQFSFSDIIVECANVQVTPNDGFPQKICADCAENVVKLYKFKRTCEAADRTLKSESKRELSVYIKEEDNFSPSEVVTFELKHLKSAAMPSPSNDFDETDHDAWPTEYLDDKIVSNDPDIPHPDKQSSPTDRCINCQYCRKVFRNIEQLSWHVKLHYKFLEANDDIKSEILDGKLVKEQSTREKPTTAKRKYKFRSYDVDVKKKGMRFFKKCEVCGEMQPNLLSLRLHMKSQHSLTESLRCKLCCRKFFIEDNLKQHVEVAHGNGGGGGKSFLCSECGIGFSVRSNLKVHMRIHTGEKPYECKQCHTKFAQWSSLYSHRLTHTQERRHNCPECDKKFSRISALYAHIKTHTGERSHTCHLCNKLFTSSHSLKKHMVVHTGAKDFQCSFCEKEFNRKSTLTVHERIHTGEKPHSCDICGKSFIQAHVLRSHLKTHTRTNKK